MDTIDQARRSANMARIRSRDTKPELVVRRLAHSMGLRFRIYRKDLPGTPDLVLPKHRLAVFVNGCFWHRHHGCSKASTPSTRREFWDAKFRATVSRDKRKAAELSILGWRVLTLWECEVKDPELVRARLADAVKSEPSA